MEEDPRYVYTIFELGYQYKRIIKRRTRNKGKDNCWCPQGSSQRTSRVGTVDLSARVHGGVVFEGTRVIVQLATRG